MCLTTKTPFSKPKTRIPWWPSACMAHREPRERPPETSPGTPSGKEGALLQDGVRTAAPLPTARAHGCCAAQMYVLHQVTTVPSRDRPHWRPRQPCFQAVRVGAQMAAFLVPGVSRQGGRGGSSQAVGPSRARPEGVCPAEGTTDPHVGPPCPETLRMKAGIPSQ